MGFDKVQEENYKLNAEVEILRTSPETQKLLKQIKIIEKESSTKTLIVNQNKKLKKKLFNLEKRYRLKRFRKVEKQKTRLIQQLNSNENNFTEEEMENLKKEYEQNLNIFESMKPESEFYHGETNIQTLDEKLKKLKIKIEFFEADTKHYKSQIENVSFEINKLQAPIIKNLENQIQNLTKELEFEKQKFENQKLDFDELY